VTAIEVFDGPSVPVGPEASCGAVVIWAMPLRHPEDPDFTGNLRGRVVGLDGILPDSVELRLRPGGNEARLDDQGRFDFGSLPPALYFLDTGIPDWGTWSTRVELRAYATADVVIEVIRRRLPDGT